MEALRLQKKYPEVSRDEMLDLINRFKCVCANTVAALLRRF
jgi:plastin-1